MKTSINGEFLKGHIDTIILKMLYDGDRYGYDIIKEIEQKTEGEFKVKQATLYSSLRRLESQGFLSSYWGEKTAGGRKKYYTLTPMGKEVFAKNQTDWRKSKDIIDNLVSGQNDANDYVDAALNLDDEADLEEIAFNQASECEPEPDLKNNFEEIFGKLNSEKSYVDDMVNRSYKPQNQSEAKFAFDFFDGDEEPFSELVSPALFAEDEQSQEEDESSYNFLEPPTQSSETPQSTEENAIRAKAKQILLEAKAQSPLSPPAIEAQAEKSEVEFIKYNSTNSERIVSDSEIIARDYQMALSKLVKDIKRQPQTEVINTRIQQEKKLEGVRQEAMLMGDSVVVRRHDNTVKQYNSENYFYKNRLMLVHYGIMFVFMLLQIVAAFGVFELVLKNGPIAKIDLATYIFAVLIALFLPVYAFFCSYKDYHKRKLREKNFKGSITFRIIILLQLLVVISAIAVYRGILTANFNDYLATFVMPSALAVNVVWSYLIYLLLLRSNKFNV